MSGPQATPQKKSPVAKSPVAKSPVVKKPVVKKPVVKKPVAKKPVTAKSPAKAPVVVEPKAPAVAHKPWWRHTWAVVSAAVAIIGAITGVISIVPLVFRDATTLDSLVVTVDAVESEFAPTFAVPLTAAWSEFPISTSVCDPTQLAWLQSNGTLLEERFLVSVANAAKEGAMMSLKDFRGEGDVEPAPPTTVAVTCDQTGGGDSNLRSASLDAASGRTAVYVQPDPTLPDNPLVFNLAPGENGQFAITIRSSADFRGSIVFVEALGTETRQVILPIGEVALPGTAPTRFTVAGGNLVCVATEDCVPADVLAALSVAAGLS